MTALYNLGRYPECLQAVEDGLKLDPENSVLKPMVDGLKLDVAETPAVKEAGAAAGTTRTPSSSASPARLLLVAAGTFFLLPFLHSAR